MDLLQGAILTAVTAAATYLVLLGDPARSGVAGTLLGGVVGFLSASLIEQSRRRHEDAHRFEQDRRALYVRFLDAVSDVDQVIRDRNIVFAVRREYPGVEGQMRERPDTRLVDNLTDEIQILAPFPVYASARLLSMALDALLTGEADDDDSWNKLSHDLISARSVFLRRAKNDLGTPTGVMTRWQYLRYRVTRRR